MDTSITNPNDLSTKELKEKLRDLGLLTKGSKAELIGRLVEADPSGSWMQETVEVRGDIREATPANEVAGTSTGTAGIGLGEREVALYRQQSEIFKKEKELAMRELALARQEIEMLKRFQELRLSTERERVDAEQVTATTPPPIPRQRSNIHLVADLVKNFGGELGEYNNWEMQLRLLKTTHCLDDDQIKILIGMKLKGKALEWLHSKPSHIVMPTEELLSQLRGMFQFHPNILHLRKQFEERVWRRPETFHEYVHQKMILANRVPIDDREIVLHLIQGIPDPVLRDQARLHKFQTKEALLEAFEDVMLRGPTFSRGQSDIRHGDKVHLRPAIEKSKKEERRQDSRFCFNCGEANHLGYNCPTRADGAKCFRCNERGHIARKCPKAQATKEQVCTVAQVPWKKYVTEVTLNDNKIVALVDTGSDLSLMRSDQHVRLGSPKLEEEDVTFRGVGSDNNKTKGVFQTNLIIDDNFYTTSIHVVSDELISHKLLLGTDFLDTVEINVRNGIVSIQPTVEIPKIDHQLPEIFQIDVISCNEFDITVPSGAHQEAIKSLIRDYRIEKIRDVPVKMSILLKDEEPVYQRARRLSPSERDFVNAQIKEWIDEGIVRPSLSEYASPIVLVKKKTGMSRLCVDYRKLNEKIIKDRYPLPLIEDQLDLLQSAKYYSTLDLRNGFFHVLLDESSRKYTAFITPDGHYEFLRVPFGLCNSPSVLQRYINIAFKDLIRDKVVLTYLDDLIIPSIDLETGINNLKRVLRVASETGLEINWEKCCFYKPK